MAKYSVVRLRRFVFGTSSTAKFHRGWSFCPSARGGRILSALFWVRYSGSL